MEIKGNYGKNLVIINSCQLELPVVVGVYGSAVVLIWGGCELVRDSGVYH